MERLPRREFLGSWFLRRGRPWSRVVVALSVPMIVLLWLVRFGIAA
jgi:hypothetical protein